jgi:hypothetical protein
MCLHPGLLLLITLTYDAGARQKQAGAMDCDRIQQITANQTVIVILNINLSLITANAHPYSANAVYSSFTGGAGTIKSGRQLSAAFRRFTF